MIATISSARRSHKILILLLALIAMLGVATASTSPAHLHLTSSSNRCDLCFTAQIAAFENPSVQLLQLPAVTGRLSLFLAVTTYIPVNSQPNCSRGPPAPFFPVNA